MFDIGFAELLLISVVGLLVLGPERLPGAIRTVSMYLGKFRRSFNSIKREIEREIKADELKQQIHNDAVMQSLKQAEEDLRGGIRDAVGDTPYEIGDIVDETIGKEPAGTHPADSGESTPDPKP